MIDPPLDWVRFWFPAGSRVSESHGYLPDPDVAHRRLTSEPTGVQLDSLSNLGCLILLGVPGMGKTSEMKHAAAQIERLGGTHDFIALGRLTGAAELESLLLNVAQNRSHSISDNAWYIFLDGLDEALSQLGQLETILPEVFARLIEKMGGPARLRVRISCRSAEWPSALETELRKLWTPEQFGVFELERLRERDVAAAARERLGVDRQQAFMEQVRNHDAEPLASRPITLNMLLNVFREESELPRHQVQLYRKGLLTAIEEANTLRRASRHTGRLDLQSKIMVAARIAAATIFSNNSEIWAGLQSEGAPSRAVILSEIAGGYEPAMGSSFPVGEPELQELLLTSIFSRVGHNTFIWTHQTFAEFLAAYYLIEHELPANQAVHFIRSSDADSAGVPPQLREVAAWLASMDPEIFRYLVRTEPDILLRSDVASAAAEDREALVKELLKRFDQEELHDFSRDTSFRYDRLKHPTLAVQLTPYIVAKAKNVVVRRAAIDIAQANGLTELGAILADVALDHSDEVHIRALAASALASLNVSDQRIRLRPLVQGDHKDDIDDEIKGSALRALWPSYISVQELLDALTLPKTENLIGAYWGFLHRFEAPPLRTEEAIAVVQWAGTVLKRPSSSAIWFYRTIPRFLKAAWTRIDEASVREAFAEFFVTTYHDDSPLSDDKMNDFAFVYRETELEHRRLFVREILRRAVQADERLGWLALNRPIAFVTPTDLEWLVGELDSAEANIPNRSIIDLIVHLSFARRIDELGFVWSAADRHGALNDALTAAYSVNLSSAVAKWQRDDARSQKRAAQENMLFDINKQISDDLFKIETQNSFDWWRLNLTFFCRTDGRLEPGKEFEANLTKTEGWARTLPELRIRIVRGAYSYLKRNRIRSSPWLGTNTFNRPAAAGYRAFRLLYSEAPELYRRIDHSTWAKWAAAIIGVSFNLNAEEREVRGKIVQQCYELTPSHVRRILDRILRKRSSEVELMDVLELLKRGFDDDLGEFLWKFSAQLAEGDARAGRILCFLVKMKYQAAMQLALDCMAVAAPAPGTPLATLDTLISAVVMLVRTSTRLSWPSFVNTWDRNSEIAVRVLKELAEDWGFRDEPFYSELDEGQLADLFIWSYRNIPPPVDERSGRGRFLTAFDHVEQLRNSILHNLVARSTAASVAAVKRMVESLPDLPWLKWKLIDARRALNAGSWKRLWPPDVISTIASYRPLLPIRSTKAAIKAAAWRIEDAVAASSSRSLTDVRDEIPFSDARPSEPLHWTPRRILAVASEWSSDHGGLSTLNRDLCIALATLGHTVICAVREATEREIADAAAARVLIVVPPDVPAPEGTDPLLFFTRRTLSRLAPEVVLGHDHITGAAAFQISRGILDQVPYVHFVHTLPEEIEPFKSRSGNSYLRGAKKAEDQLKLCSLAQLVVAIGPRIYREVQTRFASSSSVAVAQLRPGLNARLLAHKADPSKLLSRYCLFIARLEDSDVKGAELACRVIYQLSSCWHEPVKPRLIMRGFSSENQIIAIPGFDSAKPYVVARPYSGSLEEIATDIRSSSVMIMPSKREGFGLVGLDGISAGVPILVSSESGLAELLLEQDIVAAIGRTVADSCVADVDGDSGSIAGDWTKRLQKIFSDAQAFAQSERLRAALRPILTWENAAQQLSADIDMIVGT